MEGAVKSMKIAFFNWWEKLRNVYVLLEVTWWTEIESVCWGERTLSLESLKERDLQLRWAGKGHRLGKTRGSW